MGLLEAKALLMQIKKLDKLIENKQIEIQKLRNQLTYKGITYGDKVQASIIGNPTTKTIAQIVDYEKELNEDIDKLIDLKKETTKIIDSLDDAEEIDLLYQRYFQYKEWEEIAVNIGMTCRNVYRLHGRALLSIENKLSCH